jgi:hypothetical protein
MVWTRPLLIAAPFVLAACSSGTQGTGFVERLGDDTLAVEEFLRAADHIEGRVLLRWPITRVASYTATLGPDETITRLEIDWVTPPENPEGPGPEHVVIELAGDSATVVRQAADSADTTRIEVPERTIPTLGKTPVAVAFWEQAVRQARASGEEEWSFNMLTAGRASPAENAITRRSPDTVAMGFFGMPMLAGVDPDGHILGISGHETTFKVQTERVRSLNVQRLAADFATRDARGEGLGVPSPPDSVVAIAGGANFRIDYSQPAKRGREIWGSLVPFNEIWRTGADAATMFSTDRDLVIGGARVPAGDYTLWSTFTETTDTLIINEQTGQWGTAYDGSYDLVRVPMERGELSEPVERFTMEIEPRDEGGVLRLMWDRRVLWVDMQVVN